jgi:hypothetical protein
MKGAEILINGNQPNGRFLEGTVSGTPAPGTCMEVLPATEPVNGRFTYRACTSGSNGDSRPTTVLLEDALQGVTPDINGANTYVNGARCFLYVPVPGDELNMLVENISGTGDSHAIGDLLMIDRATAGNHGKLLVQDSAGHSAPFTCMETSTGLTVDTLLACRFG